MSVIADLSIDADQFLLGRIVAAMPAMSVEIERVVPTKRRVMPYIWGHGSNLAAFVGALEADEAVASVTVVEELDDRALYRIEWNDSNSELLAGIDKSDATILEAYAGDEWAMRIRFEDHGGLARFSRYCNEHDIRFYLEQVTALSDAPPADRHVPLTAPQYEALTLAHERGYFEIPRRVTMAELASELDVSVQALSERIRRGVDQVLHRVLDEQVATGQLLES